MQQTPTASSGASASEQTALLSVRNLATHFPLDEGNVIAVDGVSFDLYDGKTLGIVGESGCGKSVTALSIMRILDRPGKIVEGEILFRNRSRTSLKILVYDGQGFWLCTKRLSSGRLKWWPKSAGSPLTSLAARELQILLWNGNPSKADCGEDWRHIEPGGRRPLQPHAH